MNKEFTVSDILKLISKLKEEQRRNTDDYFVIGIEYAIEAIEDMLFSDREKTEAATK